MAAPQVVVSSRACKDSAKRGKYCNKQSQLYSKSTKAAGRLACTANKLALEALKCTPDLYTKMLLPGTLPD